MAWTEEQLKNHPKHDQLLGLKPQQKASDADLIVVYKQTGSVWKTAEKFGMCGQSVWERLTRLCLIESVRFTPEQETLIKKFYETNFKKGDLKNFCAKHNLLPTSVARWARLQKLTNKERECNDRVVAEQSKLSTKWHQKNPHPKGMLGKHHTPDTINIISAASIKSAKNRTQEQEAARLLKIAKTKAANGTLIQPRKSSWKQGWYTINKRRFFFRSRWEVNYAFYLDFLRLAGDIKAWDYEPETFWFDGIKRGTNNYTPDFKITRSNGSFEFHEVKGWMDDRSKTKLNRMRIYHPEIKMVLIDKHWFKEHKALSKTVPGWLKCRI